MRQEKRSARRGETDEDWMEEFMEFQDQVVSTTDCTGLIPSMPQTNAQAESYTKLYPIPNQKPQSDFQNHKP